MTHPPEREPISAVINNKRKLEAIRNFHFSKGNSHMSMTRILETLIDREHKRLKLCLEKESTPAS